MKRSHSDDDESIVAKKHIISDERGNPKANGQEEPSDGDQLEAFRKEAIYRRMKHYSREHERSLDRIAELEKRKSSYEAGLAAITACWSQLLGTIRQLAPPESLPPQPETTKPLFDLRQCLTGEYSSTIQRTLEETRDATHDLVSRFIQMGGADTSGLLRDAAFRKYQDALSESAALRSEVEVVRSKLKETEEHKSTLYIDLTAAENLCRRLQSKSVAQLQPKKKLENHTEVQEKRVSSPVPTAVLTNGHADVSGHLDALESTYRSQIATLEQERRILREENQKLTVESQFPSAEAVQASPHYKVLMDLASQLTHTVKEQQDKIAALLSDLERHVEQRDQSEKANSPLAQEVSDLKTMIGKRDADIARLRETRDQQLAEINERKQKDSVKFSFIDELKSLNTSQSERISVLESQLKRNKAQLAARAGHEDLMKYLLDGKYEAEYVGDLKSRLDSAEAKIVAVTQAIPSDQQDNVLGHSEALHKLSETSNQLQKYQRVYGDLSSESDMTSLRRQLELRDAELQKLTLLDSQREQNEATLYAEVDKLTAAWETLERQVKSKVFDLAGLEDKLSKSGLDRAKSENKYYASMREKEAIEAERRNLVRVQEKQAKSIEKLVESEKSLQSQVLDIEKEVILYKKKDEQQSEFLRIVQRQRDEARIMTQEEVKKSAHVTKLWRDQTEDLETRKSELRKKEEQFVKGRLEMEKEITKARSEAVVASSAGKETGLKREYDHAMQLLKCSTCKSDFREVIITKCMHTFCKACVEARISTRQRKCPSCSMTFAQSDVQTLYFQ